MSIRIFGRAAAAGVAMVAGASSASAQADAGATSPDRVSYAIGFDLGAETAKGLKADGVTINPDLVAKGLADGLRGQGTSFTAAQVDATLVALHKELATRKVKARMESDPVFRALCEDNARKSKTFHENFAKKEGVVTLPSGCQYLPITKGAGQPVADCSKVVVNYKALTINGAEYGRGEQAEVEVSTMNEGAQELIRLMREGDKWQAAIPPARAFGEIGKEPHIGPNESLIAEVEIVRAIK